MFEAIVLADQLLYGNRSSRVAVTTLWSRRDKVAAALDPRLYAVMGQLYSPTRGLSPLFRNLLYNPSIRHLVVAGRDLGRGGRALRDFFEHGAARAKTPLGREAWVVRSDVEAYFDVEISEEAVAAIRAHVKAHFVEQEELAALLERLARLEQDDYGPRREFPAHEEPRPAVLPAPDVVRVVRGAHVADAWLEALDRVMRFGREGRTHYGARQKEILDLVTVVEKEDPASAHLPEYFPFGASQLEDYLPRVLSAREYADTSYTYGGRLRAHFGVDQVKAMIDKLAGDLDRRSAVAVLWDPRADNSGHGAPCVNHLWARAREGRLFLTAVIRSNDMYSAWPLNALALRRLQETIRQGVESRSGAPLVLGELVILSESAHVYEDCWDAAARVVREHFPAAPEREFDPCGSFVVSIAGGRIVCEHISPSGERIGVYTGASAAHVSGRIERDGVISSVGHALYLGRELAKAETALANEGLFEYLQDRRLKSRAGGPESPGERVS